MNERPVRSCAAWLAILVLVLVAAPALAQVPQDATFTGRLVDGLGGPLAGPVDLILRVFDTDTGGTELYKERHLGVPLDATGGFSVQLGLGTSPSGPFDANLFSGVDRWLQVEVGSEVLTPRQVIGSVPWALIAQQANEIVPDPNAPRFEDCGDGTVADHQTGLLWEKKTGTLGSSVLCDSVPCPDPHIINNLYKWSGSGTAPDGGAFTDFLAKLNDPVYGAATTSSDVTGCFAGYCDWRLPIIVELQTILDCSNTPCIDPLFGPAPTQSYLSASQRTGFPDHAWIVSFQGGFVAFGFKTGSSAVRAVRVGSCR